jgi:hypothetical protein
LALISLASETTVALADASRAWRSILCVVLNAKTKPAVGKSKALQLIDFYKFLKTKKEPRADR